MRHAAITCTVIVCAALTIGFIAGVGSVWFWLAGRSW